MQVYKTSNGREYFSIDNVVYTVGMYTGDVSRSCLAAVDFPQAITDGFLKFARVMSAAEYVMRTNEIKQLNSTNC